MKPICCRLNVSAFVGILAVVDIFRAMLVSALLIGLFCGMATVYLEKLPEIIYNNTTTRVDYHQNREYLVGCIVVGITICGADILMALALDNILKKNLGRASLVWISCSLLGILLRGGFYAFLWKKEKYLGFNRLDDFTPTVKETARVLFMAAVAYEGVKLLQLIAGVASQMELHQRKDRTEKKKQGAPKRVVVGMIGGFKRWVD